MPDKIHYLYSAETGIELVFCEHSTISYPLHNHVSVLTIGIVLDGCVVLTTAQGEETCTRNQIFLLDPYVPHSISTPKHYTLLSICIDKNALMRHDVDTIQKNITALLKSTLCTEKMNPRQILQLLSCQNVFARCSGWHADTRSTLINTLKNQLELYPEQKQSIGEMAQTAFLSKYHFIRSFKAQVGLTPHQFQMQNRIRKAKRLMQQSGTITEVALTAGFCDQSHFRKHFEKQVGLSPLT